MKKIVLLLLVALVVTSCEIIVVDPLYDQRDQVTGSYQVEEYSESYNSSIRYSMYVSKAGSGNDIYLDNFYNSSIRVRAELSGGKIYIPWQLRDGYEIEGVGTVYGNSISLSYNVRDTYNHYATDYCTSEAWRQW